ARARATARHPDRGYPLGRAETARPARVPRRLDTRLAAAAPLPRAPGAARRAIDVADRPGRYRLAARPAHGSGVGSTAPRDRARVAAGRCGAHAYRRGGTGKPALRRADGGDARRGRA